MSLVRVKGRFSPLLADEGVLHVAMERLPAKLLGVSLNARLDAIARVCVSRLVVPPSVFGRAVGVDRSVIEPNKVVASLRHRSAADPRSAAAQSQQFVL